MANHDSGNGQEAQYDYKQSVNKIKNQELG